MEKGDKDRDKDEEYKNEEDKGDDEKDEDDITGNEGEEEEKDEEEEEQGDKSRTWRRMGELEYDRRGKQGLLQVWAPSATQGKRIISIFIVRAHHLVYVGELSLYRSNPLAY